MIALWVTWLLWWFFFWFDVLFRLLGLFITINGTEKSNKPSRTCLPILNLFVPTPTLENVRFLLSFFYIFFFFQTVMYDSSSHGCIIYRWESARWKLWRSKIVIVVDSYNFFRNSEKGQVIRRPRCLGCFFFFFAPTVPEWCSKCGLRDWEWKKKVERGDTYHADSACGLRVGLLAEMRDFLFYLLELSTWIHIWKRFIWFL